MAVKSLHRNSAGGFTVTLVNGEQYSGSSIKALEHIIHPRPRPRRGETFEEYVMRSYPRASWT